MRTRFIIGEDKYVKIRVNDPKGQPFEIFSATYELKRYGELVQSGNAFIDGDDNHDISARIRPEQTGQHLKVKIIGYERQEILGHFQNTEKTKKMTVVNDGKSTVFEGYTWDSITEYTGKIYEVSMAAPGQTFAERLDSVERSAEDLTLMMAELIGGGEV